MDVFRAWKEQAAEAGTHANSFAASFTERGDEPLFRRMFDDIDLNGSGYLDVEEFATFLNNYMVTDPEEVQVGMRLSP